MYIYTRMSVRNFVYSKDLEGSCGQYSVTNCRCDVSAFDLRRCVDFRRSMWRLSKIDVSPFEDRWSMSRCVDLRRSMCRPSEIDVLTFEDRWSTCRPSKIGDWCVDLRRSVIDVSIFEDRWSMCRPSKIDGRCEIRLLYLLKTLILYISCMRITPRVCTSVLSFD